MRRNFAVVGYTWVVQLLVGVAIFVAGAVLLAVLIYLLLRTGGDAVIGGSGSMEEADREAKARSAGIDHLSPPN